VLWLAYAIFSANDLSKGPGGVCGANYYSIVMKVTLSGNVFMLVNCLCIRISKIQM